MSDETALSPGCEILLLEDDAPLRKRLAVNLRHRGADVTLMERVVPNASNASCGQAAPPLTASSFCQPQ
jgi:ActR/RegA family two-component response regulator